MNIEPNGAVRKPAPHTKNDDDAVIAALLALDSLGQLIGAAPAPNPAKSVIPASRHARLGQDAAEITEWRARWHRENPGKPPVDSARYYAREIYKFRPEKDDDPEGFREWKDRLSPAQADTLEEANEPKLEAKRALWREEYRLKILIEENRVVTPYQRNPTPERKREQGRDRQAKCMAKKSDAERKAQSNRNKQAQRAREKAAAAAAATPAPAPVPVTTPAHVSTSAPVPVTTPASVTPITVTVIDDRIAVLHEGLRTRSRELATLDLSQIDPAEIAQTSAWVDQQLAEIARAQAAKAAAVTSADPGGAVVAWLVAEAELADDGDDQTDLTDELAELDEALAAAAA